MDSGNRVRLGSKQSGDAAVPWGGIPLDPEQPPELGFHPYRATESA